jgi:ParB family transcriptional regulator, chromosome partitioning protein
MSPRDPGPRLGKGLAALIGDPATQPGAAPRALSVDLLEPGPFQPRSNFDPEALKELTESIRTNGVLQPILARPHPGERHRYQIIAGERRWRASQLAGLREIPVLLRDLTDTEAMAASLVENLQRQDLNPIEEAEGYRRLLQEFGLTQEQLGTAVGKSRPHVTNSMRLLALPSSVRHDVEAGRLSAGHGRALLAHPEPEIAALNVIARNLNVRQTEELVRQATAPKPKLPPSAPTETDFLARELSNHLGLKVDVSFNGRGGQVKISYKNLDQLDGLVRLLKP